MEQGVEGIEPHDQFTIVILACVAGTAAECDSEFLLCLRINDGAEQYLPL